MANILAPYGFQPIGRLDGVTANFKITSRRIKAANTNRFFKGDVVKVLSGANQGYIDLLAAGAATLVAGVFWGCRYLSISQGRVVWGNQFPGSDAAADVEAYIIDDPFVVFKVQTAGTSGGPIGTLGSSTVGQDLNFDINTGVAGNQQTGISGMALDDNTGAVTSTLPFRLYAVPGIDPTGATVNSPTAGLENGLDPTTKFNVAYVVFNNQNYKALTAV